MVGAPIRLNGRALTVELAREVLRDLIHSRSEILSIEQIQKAVASYFNVKVTDLKGDRRSRIVSTPRQVAMYLCRKHTKASFPEIGHRFGGHGSLDPAGSHYVRADAERPQLGGERFCPSPGLG